MSPSDIIIIVFVALAVIATGIKIYRQKKENPGSCSGCSGCSSHSCSSNLHDHK